jgi:hypothetical protein
MRKQIEAMTAQPRTWSWWRPKSPLKIGVLNVGIQQSCLILRQALWLNG